MFQRRYPPLLIVAVAVLMMVSCGFEIGISVDSKPSKQTAQPTVSPEMQSLVDKDTLSREILFFTMKGCPPCEAAQPKVRAIRRQGVKVTEIDFYSNPELVSKYNITQTPTFIVLEDGVEVERTSSITALILILVKLLAIVLPLLLG